MWLWRQIVVDGEWELAAGHAEKNIRKHLKCMPISPLSKSNFCPFNIRLTSCIALKSPAQINTVLRNTPFSELKVFFFSGMIHTGFG